MNMTRPILVLALGLATAHGAKAADPGFYVGGGFGESDFSGDIAGQIDRAYGNFQPLVLESSRLSDDGDSAWKLFAGYRFGFWGVEFAWHDLGEARAEYAVSANAEPLPQPPTTISSRYELAGQSLTVFGEWAFDDRISAVLRGGVFRADLDYSEVSTTGPAYTFSHGDDGDLRATVGVGLNWRMTPSWDLRLDYDRFNNLGKRFDLADESNGRFDHVSMLSLNLAYRFGR